MSRHSQRSRREHSALRVAVAVSVTALCLITSAFAEPVTVTSEAVRFAPGIASTEFSEVRLTISPDGKTALWFSRNRPGGPGGYDIWMSHKMVESWSPAIPVPFNSPTRDFDPAFSPDGAYVYFCSDRPGGMGGDDVYRVPVTDKGFGEAEPLGPSVNSARNEFAPMLSPDQTQLLFSSDRAGGAGAHDLYIARLRDGEFDAAERLRGDINTEANEFDATFLSDSETLVFARAMDFRTDRIDLFVATRRNGKYEPGTLLPQSINTKEKDTYGPMLDWSDTHRLTFSAQRADATSMDLYVVRFELRSSKEQMTDR
jgi:Tol biopolymer transport system component